MENWSQDAIFFKYKAVYSVCVVFMCMKTVCKSVRNVVGNMLSFPSANFILLICCHFTVLSAPYSVIV